MTENQAYDYRGKRALVLLRVSTEEQEKKYGFSAQLRSILGKLIEPYGLRIPDEETHIIRDTYTGMEFREMEALQLIREMAKRREFDVLVTDVLDRLGRTGMPREIYRAELKMLGIHFLTTKEEEHADDDSMLGQMIRLWHGWKSEGERNDIVRRTQDGKRERILKDHKLAGAPEAKYGWKFKDEEKGAYILNNDPIKIEQDGRILLDETGEPWTEVKVRRYMFDMVDQGKPIRIIAAYLSSQHIPTKKEGRWNKIQVRWIISKRHLGTTDDKPILAYGYLPVLDENDNSYTETSIAQIVGELDDKGMKLEKIAEFLNQKHIPTGREACWLASTVSIMLGDEYVIGKAPVYVSRVVRDERHKRHVEKIPQNQWIYLPEGVVPPILVTDDGRPDIAKFERVQQQLERNQKSSARNNQQPYSYLLRGGFIKCGYCGRNMLSGNLTRGRHVYRCYGSTRSDGVCKSYNFLPAHNADALAFEKALEIIRNPSEIDRRLNSQKTADPNAERRQYITGEIAKIEVKRKRLRNRIEDEDLDDETYTDIKLRLKELADMKQGYESELNIEINVHEEWKKTQDKLKHFHKRCQEMLNELHDSNYEPDYAFKRDAIEFLGIVVYVWRPEHDPKYTVEAHLPSIVSGVS